VTKNRAENRYADISINLFESRGGQALHRGGQAQHRGGQVQHQPTEHISLPAEQGPSCDGRPALYVVL
jgi:hypothetical protein